MKHLPYPQASIVVYKRHRYFIDEVGCHADDYAILGHSSLNSEGYGIAWINHDELEFISGPTLENWEALLDAREEEAGEYEED